MGKRDCHQARKDFNKKKYMKGKECRNFHEDERKIVYQKTQEKWYFMKDHSSWQGWAKIKIHQERKFNQIEEDEEKKSKIHFIKKVCSVKSRKIKVH